MEDRKFLFKTIDNPPRVLFWGMDEFLILAAPLFLSLCLGSILVIFVGVFLRPCYSKIKKKFPHGSFKHKLYWYLPGGALSRIKSLPPSHHRELLL